MSKCYLADSEKNKKDTYLFNDAQRTAIFFFYPFRSH